MSADPVTRPVDDSARPGHDDGLRRHLRIIAEFGRLALQPELQLNELLQAACEAACEGTLVDKAKALIYDARSGDLRIMAGVGWAAGVIGMHVPADMRSVPGKALRSVEPVVVDLLPSDPAYDYNEPMASHRVVSVCNVPIRTDEDPLGVLEINSTEPLRLGGDAIRFLNSLAGFVASAIVRINAEGAARAAADAAVTAAAQRELLHAELEHRVANNFQSIQMALRVEQQRATDEATRAALGRILERVGAAVDVHRRLDERSAAQRVPVRSLLRSLCDSFNTGSRVEITLSASDWMLPLRQAILVGRLVNEIVVNALKHAFKGSGPGRIAVDFTAHAGTGRCTLTVSDSGRGMGPTRRGGRGLGLIAALADQLGATLRQDDTPGSGGTRYTIEFDCGADPVSG